MRTLPKWPEPITYTLPGRFDSAKIEPLVSVVELLHERARADAAIARLKVAVEAMRKIGAFDDKTANHWLKEANSYGAFDEPGSVEMAREALALIGEVPE